MAQQLLDSHADPVVRKALVQAIKGDSPLLRMFLGYILGPRRDAPVKTGPLPVHTAEETDPNFRVILESGLRQDHPAGDAQLSALIEIRRRVIETRDLEERMRVLEESVAKQN